MAFWGMGMVGGRGVAVERSKNEVLFRVVDELFVCWLAMRGNDWLGVRAKLGNRKFLEGG